MLKFGPNFTVLAPLAGYTDLPFRSVVKKFGVDLTVSWSNLKGEPLILRTKLSTEKSIGFKSIASPVKC